MITSQDDDFKSFAEGTEKENWKPEDYASAFTKLNLLDRKASRIHALIQERCGMDSRCGYARYPGHIDPAYKKITEASGGTLYRWGYSTDTNDIMRDLANKAVFRAFVQAKRRILLSKTPTDPSTIELWVAGKRVTHDLWAYDAKTNEVVIEWQLFDLNALKSGDLIQIKYSGHRL